MLQAGGVASRERKKLNGEKPPGIRIKATEGDTGSIKGVTYNEITLTDISEYVFSPYLSIPVQERKGHA